MIDGPDFVDPLRLYILNEEYEPVPTDEHTFLKDRGNPRNRTAHDWIVGIDVSTVFLGLDHGWGRTPKPILWESLVRGGKHDRLQWRYTSQKEAVMGHATLVRMVRRALR